MGMGAPLALLAALSMCVPVSSLYRDGYEVIETGPGGFFGAVLDESTGTAWFGVDDAPTRVVRIDLNTMSVTGKLELNADEQRLWCFVKHGNFGYLGVEAPGGRLVGIDLQKMERLGYATASQFPLLAGVVEGDSGYFSAGSNPATVMRLHLKQMQDGKCADWSQCRFEVALNQGEEAVRTMFADGDKHLILAMYTSPGRIVKMSIPDLTRVAHLDLRPHEQKILSGARYGHYGIFGTATSPGRLIKVDLRSMSRAGDCMLIDGEDRPAAIIVHGRHAYIGFGSAWAEGTSSVLKVDLERMVRVAAVITRDQQTWLYTGLGYKDYAFFGTRGTEMSKHATIVRINTNPTFPGIPVPPVYNSSGSDYIEVNWLREYPEYHNGGAPIIGARVLLRPSDHHDWTAEHVYGYAAPDPAAPKDRIKRVHEEPVELEDHGYVARVDKLSAESGYKFAVILTNEIGPSHRSRSSLEMRTAVAEMIELMWIGVTTVVWGLIIVVYFMSSYNAPRIDALYTDTESEEEANSSLLRSAKSFTSAPPAPPPGAGAASAGSGAAGKIQKSVSAFVSQPSAVRQLVAGCTMFSVLGLSSMGLQILFVAFVHDPQPWLAQPSRYLYSGVAVVCSGALAVASVLVAWGLMLSSLTTILAWTSARLSPDTAYIASSYSTLALGCGLVGVVAESIVAILRVHAQPTETVALPEFGISNWLTERL